MASLSVWSLSLRQYFINFSHTFSNLSPTEISWFLFAFPVLFHLYIFQIPSQLGLSVSKGSNVSISLFISFKSTCYSRWSGKDTAAMWVWNHQHTHTFSSLTTTSDVPHKVGKGKWQRQMKREIWVSRSRWWVKARGKLLTILPSYIYNLQSNWPKGLFFFLLCLHNIQNWVTVLFLPVILLWWFRNIHVISPQSGLCAHLHAALI